MKNIGSLQTKENLTILTRSAFKSTFSCTKSKTKTKYSLFRIWFENPPNREWVKKSAKVIFALIKFCRKRKNCQIFIVIKNKKIFALPLKLSKKSSKISFLTILTQSRGFWAYFRYFWCEKNNLYNFGNKRKFCIFFIFWTFWSEQKWLSRIFFFHTWFGGFSNKFLCYEWLGGFWFCTKKVDLKKLMIKIVKISSVC